MFVMWQELPAYSGHAITTPPPTVSLFTTFAAMTINTLCQTFIASDTTSIICKWCTTVMALHCRRIRCCYCYFWYRCHHLNISSFFGLLIPLVGIKMNGPWVPLIFSAISANENSYLVSLGYRIGTINIEKPSNTTINSNISYS